GGGGRFGGASSVQINLNIGDLQEGLALARNVEQLLLDHVPEVQDISISMVEGLPQIIVDIDRERAYNMGLTVSAVASEISAAMNGVTATTFRLSGNEYSVVLQLDSEDRRELPDLGRVFVRSSRGILYPVSNFASFDITQAPVSIRRENQSRTISISANLVEGAILRDTEAKIQSLMSEQQIAATYGGSFQDASEMIRTFLLVIALALILVFGVMAAQYESFKSPFINFMTIPLLLIGVVLIHIITGAPITAFTLIGILLLIGVVVNNGILLVDYTNQLVRGEAGMSVTDACLEAGVVRFRPVLMTALTTMMGLAPMAFFPGTASMITAPIGLVVFGGLASATVITLVFIPVIYSLFHSKQKEPINED
ncbi:MAG: efflux RND transporter permease subunit, partial [Treponema sp.]|nr:efflux RND transporter permease subunit [Treponema sp.]